MTIYVTQLLASLRPKLLNAIIQPSLSHGVDVKVVSSINDINHPVQPLDIICMWNTHMGQHIFREYFSNDRILVFENPYDYGLSPKEYAIRCKLVEQYESTVEGEMCFKFDTMAIGGDYTIIKIPLFFGEEVARYELFKLLSEMK